MTLICASVCKRYFCALADIMISHKGSKSLRHSIANPLHHGTDRGLLTSSKSFRLKSVIKGKHMIMWTGSMMAARREVRRLLDNPKISKQEMIRKIDDMNLEENEDLHLIYCHSGNEGISILGTNECYCGEENGATLVSAGSGSGDMWWREYGDPVVNRHVNVPDSVDSLFMRFGEVIHRELTSDSHHEKFYGGGYEIIITDKMKNFKRASYCIDFFDVNDESTLGHVSRSYYHYIGNILYIVSCTAMENHSSSLIHSKSVCDVLTSLKGNSKIDLRKLKPDFRFSYINRMPNGYNFMSGHNGIDMSFSSGKVEVEVSEKYIEWQREMAAKRPI